MSTAINMIAAKFAVAFVAIAMLLSLVAPAANAQTTEELQKMINDLLAQVAALQGDAADDTTSAAGVCPFTWTRTLNMGATGADVMKLQQFLNADAETRVAASGAGSAGMETEYYGPATGAAVAKFQTKYRADILTPLGLVNATTFFGNSTMAKANALCVAGSDDEDEDDDATDEDEDEDEDEDQTLSGEASLGEVDLKDGDETEIEEGQENAPVAEFEVEFEDGDAMINRIDITLVAQGTEEDPWDTFEAVSLWVDGDMVAEMAADDEDEYLDEDDGSLRFSGLDIFAAEDDTTVITIGVTTQNGIDDLSATWDVDVTDIRYTDADDVTTTDDVTVDEVSFDIDEEGSDDELSIKTSSNDPDATTLAVEDDANSDFMTVFAFKLDSDDSTNDIELNNVTATVTASGDVVNQVVNDAKIMIDGEEFDDFTWTNDTTATATIDFDIDGDYVIEAGEEVEVEVMLEFKKTTGNYTPGQTIQVSTNATGYDAEGATDVTPTGSATGETHTLRVEGLIVEPGDSEEDTQGDTDATGIFTLTFDVTAFENDFYVAEYATTTGVSTLGGVNFSVEGPAAVTSASGVLSSTADEENTGVFTVREGETETFTLTVTVDASASGQHRVNLGDVWYSATNNGTASIITDPANPAQDYRTGYININAS